MDAGGHALPDELTSTAPSCATTSGYPPATPRALIDPIEELARIINEAQNRDGLDERRFDHLARIDAPELKRRPRRLRRR